MARYKPSRYAQGKFIPIHFASQTLPGTFEHTLHHLIDHELDLSRFDQRFKNDETGAPCLRSPDSAEDRSLRLLAGHRLQPQDRTSLPGECDLYGSFRRYPAPFHHHRRFHFLNGCRGRPPVPGRSPGLRRSGPDRQGDVRHRRL